MMVTILAASAGGITSTFLKPVAMRTWSKRNRYDVLALCNGILVGAVSITAVADRCEPWSAVIIGMIGGCVYVGACVLYRRLGVDDPIEASQVHGFGGIWGLIATGIFDNRKGLVSNHSEKWSFLAW